MKLLELRSLVLKSIVMFMAVTLLAACKVVFKDGEVKVKQGDGTANVPASCSSQTDGVNWGALLSENCTNLSDYNLFENSSDPTKKPNSNGLPYDLSTALFTDYASKYRFVFIPEGKKATYSEHAVSYTHLTLPTQA